MTKLFYARPVGHSDAEKLQEVFSLRAEAELFCKRQNAEVLKEYESESDWRNDEHSVEWLVFTEEELAQL